MIASKRALFVALFLSVLGLGSLTRNPRFSTFHSVDMIQLLASGICLGVALVILWSLLASPNRGDKSPRRP
jgi:hypothetical protein